MCTYGVHSLGHLLMFSKEMADAAPSGLVTSMKKVHGNFNMCVKCKNTCVARLLNPTE